MVAVAREKFARAHPAWLPRTRWLVQSALDPVPLPDELYPQQQAGGPQEGGDEGSKVGGAVPPRKYDTVVDTMGLCSVGDPAAYLARLAGLVAPAHGRILLLEHGRGDWAWLNRVLDDLAPAHADKHGCWWNRDIDRVVRESGLE
ncbi:hypothetical protein KEM52_004693, partial [Ascosphaera acerosa]